VISFDFLLKQFGDDVSDRAIFFTGDELTLPAILLTHIET
jgi:hypothetical protein